MQKKASAEKAMLRKYPEQVVLVTTRGLKGPSNIMAVGWTTVVSDDPLMIALGIDDEAYTYELILETKEFVIAFPGDAMASEVLCAGTRHGRGIDKIAEAGLKVEKASLVKAPLVADAVVNLECVLVEIFKPGNCPVVVGKVVAAHENTNARIKRLYTIGPAYSLGGVRPSRVHGSRAGKKRNR